MKKLIAPTMCFVFALAAMYGYGSVLAGEQATSQVSPQASWDEFYQAAEPVRQQLAAKRNELETLYRSGQSDAAREQALIREIGELQAQALAANAKFRAQMGAPGAYGPGRCIGGYGYGDAGYGHRGYGPRGGNRGYGHGRGHHGRW